MLMCSYASSSVTLWIELTLHRHRLQKFLHHLVLFSCPNLSEANDTDTLLYHKRLFRHAPQCPGTCGLPQWYNVWVPLGEGQRWKLLHVHYYNPNKVQGIDDNSGIRLHQTTDLRPIDAGVMAFAAGVSTGPQSPRKDVAIEMLYVEPDCTALWSGPLQTILVN